MLVVVVVVRVVVRVVMVVVVVRVVVVVVRMVMVVTVVVVVVRVGMVVRVVMVVVVYDALVRSPLMTQPRAVNYTVAEWRQCLRVTTALCRLGPLVSVKSPGTHPPLSPLPPSVDTCVSPLPVW